MFIQQISFSSVIYSDEEMSIAYNKGLSLYNRVTESISLSNVVTDDFISRTLRVIDVLKFSNNVQYGLTQVEIITDLLYLSNILKQIHEESLLDTVNFSNPISFIVDRVATIVDGYNLNNSVNSQITITDIIAVILSFYDNINFANVNYITEKINLSNVINNSYKAYIKLFDKILLSDSLKNPSFTLFLSDKLELSDTVSQTAILKSIITDELSFLGFIAFNDTDQFFAYTLNTQTNAVTKYDNYNFNSLDYPLACTENGIYLLDDSGTDDGANIVSSIKTGLMDFGTSLKKQVPYIYIGLTENGRVLLKVTTNDRGVKNERWYEANANNTALDTIRVEIGKGIKSKYWQFELTNIDGESLEIESIELLPLVLKRRI